MKEGELGENVMQVAFMSATGGRVGGTLKTAGHVYVTLTRFQNLVSITGT